MLDWSSCDSTDVFKRLFLVLSNIGFPLLGIMIFNVMYKKRTPFYTLLPEALVHFALIMSGFYHLCDSLDTCTQYCVLPYDTLWNTDFILSYSMISILVGLSIDPGFSLFKWVYYTISICFNTWFILYYPEQQRYGLMVIITISVTFTFCRWLYLKKTHQFHNDYEHHFNKKFAICGFICLVTAITMFELSIDGWYWLTHGLWHIFIQLTSFFIILTCDLSVCQCCCFKRKPRLGVDECLCETCRRMNDNINLNDNINFIYNTDPFHNATTATTPTTPSDNGDDSISSV